MLTVFFSPCNCIFIPQSSSFSIAVCKTKKNIKNKSVQAIFIDSRYENNCYLRTSMLLRIVALIVLNLILESKACDKARNSICSVVKPCSNSLKFQDFNSRLSAKFLTFSKHLFDSRATRQ